MRIHRVGIIIPPRPTTGEYTKEYSNQSSFAQLLSHTIKEEKNNDKRTINTHRTVNRNNYN